MIHLSRYTFIVTIRVNVFLNKLFSCISSLLTSVSNARLYISWTDNCRCSNCAVFCSLHSEQKQCVRWIPLTTLLTRMEFGIVKMWTVCCYSCSWIIHVWYNDVKYSCHRTCLFDVITFIIRWSSCCCWWRCCCCCCCCCYVVVGQS